jgi:hypothetical protein
MKPVPPENKGLSKLPKGVRNKMGYMAVGGMTKKKDEVKRVGGVSGMLAPMIEARDAAIKNMTKPKKDTRAMDAFKKNPMDAFKPRSKPATMAGGGMMKGYAKGGMANCGASMKPNGAARGK